MAHSRIYLVGFMGSGKTSTGRALARNLGWKFSDLDQEIELAEGQSVAQIFRMHGESRVRELERQHLLPLSTQVEQVIALGGGTFIDAGNRGLAQETGETVWLKVSFAKVCQRVKMDGTRPMLGTREETEQLYRRREPLYALA
jgi:shikimate kinase